MIDLYQKLVYFTLFVLALTLAAAILALSIPRFRNRVRKKPMLPVLILLSVVTLSAVFLSETNRLEYRHYSNLFEAERVVLQTQTQEADVTTVFHENRDRIFEPVAAQPSRFLRRSEGTQSAELLFYRNNSVFCRISVVEADGSAHRLFCSDSGFTRGYVYRFDPDITDALLSVLDSLSAEAALP